MTSMLAAARSRLDRIAGLDGVEPEALSRIKYPHKTVSASVTLRRDDGTLDLLKAWRAQYSTVLGPAKGGIRFHPDVSMDEVMTLGFWMTLKCALAGLPFGGGKGGISVDAKSLSVMEKERLSRFYVGAFKDIIGPDSDIPAPDMYTDSMVMGWMSDEYHKLTGKQERGAFTGKPVSMGGSLGRDTATADGAFFVFERLRQNLGLVNRQATIAIQGFGNAGKRFARLAADAGHKVVAVSDSSGSIFAKNGLDIEAVAKTKSEKGKIAAHKADGAEALQDKELLGLDVDLLVPAALGGVITASNADAIRASAILEIANGPIDARADDVLEKKGVEIIPDILANSGGVIVSCFEWIQNRTGDYWSGEKVRRRLKERVEASSGLVEDAAKGEGISFRDAANLVALRRISEAIRAQGTSGTYAAK